MVEYLTCTEEIRVRFTAGPFLLKWNRYHIMFTYHSESKGVRRKNRISRRDNEQNSCSMKQAGRLKIS